jgi:phosphate transport system protein
VFALKSLERIGDHAKNVAEHVVFLVSGADVRHAGAERAAAARETQH